MILNHNDRSVPSYQFLAMMPELLTGAVLVYNEQRDTKFSGWLITPRLVVIPAFAVNINTAEKYICLSAHTNNRFETIATLGEKFAEGDGTKPVILELEEPWPFAAIKPELDLVNADTPVVLLHYPGDAKEQRMSFGTVIELRGKELLHDADSQGGSSGAPLINMATGTIIGMQIGAQRLPELKNKAVSIGYMLDELKNGPFWDEILSYHKLADTRKLSEVFNLGNEAPEGWSEMEIRAAISWEFTAEGLPAAAQQQLRLLVNDPDSATWIMRTAERQTILHETPLQTLQQAAQLPGGNSIGNSVIQKILSLQPVQVDNLPENELPYWLQAARWFDGINPHIPSIADINRVMEKKKLRSQFRMLGGERFTGREDKLALMADWYKQPKAGPLVVSGVGGIGKTSLISRFVLNQPPGTVIIWLDFDRVDLKSDDPKSVLNIIIERLRVELPQMASLAASASWEETAKDVANKLLSSTRQDQPPLIVLDGFEIAQSLKGYSNIWKLFDIMLAECTYLKVIVSGRSEVKKLQLVDRAGQSLPVKGLDNTAVDAWIKKMGVTDPADTSYIQTVAKGIPLVLKLIEQYLQSGKKVQDLRKEASDVLIEGYLYRRILDRITDNELKPLAKKALVLRKISAEIIANLFPGLIPAGSNSTDLFQRLGNELALVEDAAASGMTLTTITPDGSLVMRQEVRRATLQLLAQEAALHENPAERDWIIETDRKAAEYFKLQAADIPARAELVYHLLRSHQLTEARNYWKPELAIYLGDAVEDLEAGSAEQQWLRNQLSNLVTDTGDNIKIWESKVFTTIADLLNRGHYGEVKSLLLQRQERSADSPLAVYDAWALMDNGQPAIARDMLEKLLQTPNLPSSITAPAKTLLALLYTTWGQPGNADVLLAGIEPHFWMNRSKGTLEEITLQAARIRLTVFPADELQLIDAAKNMPREYQPRKLRMWDYQTIVPQLRSHTNNRDTFYESISVDNGMFIPTRENDLNAFREQLKKLRQDWQINPSIANINEVLNKSVPAHLSQYHFADNDSTGNRVALIIKIILAAEFRWKLATESLLLADFVGPAIGRRGELDPLSLSVVSTLCAFRGEQLRVVAGEYKEPSIDSFLQRVVRNNPESAIPPLSNYRKEILYQFMTKDLRDYSLADNPSFVTGLEKEIEKQSGERKGNSYLGALLSLKNDVNTALFLYLYGPDPLEMLCRQLLGLPNNYKF